MDKRKPTLGEVREYLKKYNPLGLSGAMVDLFNEHNHLHYRLEKDGKVYCLRMINPETYRAGEWVEIAEEYVLLKRLENTGLGPKSYYVDPERFILPLMIQEFITDAICFKDFKPLAEQHLVAAAQAIALLNAQPINPDNFPFRERFTRYSYLTSVRTWRQRLDVIKKYDQEIRNYEGDVQEWAKKIEAIVDRAEEKLKSFEPLLEKATWSFNFDGAHIGNTYWKDGKVMFLDWQKVSYGDPAFTLARFLTSVEPTGEVTDEIKEIMLEAYLRKREVAGFVGLLNRRFFERQIADLVWVVSNYVNERKAASGQPLAKATSVTARYNRVKKILEEY
jgi:aminoglycoside phosphotransferase (APT) family kinase protein